MPSNEMWHPVAYYKETNIFEGPTLDKVSRFHRNEGKYLTDYKALHHQKMLCYM
jgi:hypothetical protein